MLELSTKTNLLEENDYRYSLQDVKDPGPKAPRATRKPSLDLKRL